MQEAFHEGGQCAHQAIVHLQSHRMKVSPQCRKRHESNRVLSIMCNLVDTHRISSSLIIRSIKETLQRRHGYQAGAHPVVSAPARKKMKNSWTRRSLDSGLPWGSRRRSRCATMEWSSAGMGMRACSHLLSIYS